MNYSVLWTHASLQMLASVWMKASDREAVTMASQRIDEQLAMDPIDFGESRREGERIGIDPPLQVLYRVLRFPKRVEFLSVAMF
jgi:hypothetical protein